MRMQNMKKGETTEQMALFVWAGNNTRLAVPFPYVPRPKRGEEDKRGGIKGHGAEKRRAGCVSARGKP